MILEFVILPLFFVVCNVFPLVHIIKGAVKEKSNTIWILWFLGYYLFYNSIVAPFAVVLSSVLGMRKLYYLTLTVGIGALTNPVQPMLTKVFTPLVHKGIGLWSPAQKIADNLWEIAEILCQPVNFAIVFVLSFLDNNVPGWEQSVKPLMNQMLDMTDASHRPDAATSPRASMRKAADSIKPDPKKE
jgi:hypothetical protein